MASLVVALAEAAVLVLHLANRRAPVPLPDRFGGGWEGSVLAAAGLLLCAGLFVGGLAALFGWGGWEHLHWLFALGTAVNFALAAYLAFGRLGGPGFADAERERFALQALPHLAYPLFLLIYLAGDWLGGYYRAWRNAGAGL